MDQTLNCWRCGHAQAEMLPLSRTAECGDCRAEFHCCRQCSWFDHARGCREDRAEPPRSVDAANFCDYFRLNVNPAGGPVATGADAAALDALFGADSKAGPDAPDAPDSAAELDALFRKPAGKAERD